MSIQSRMWTWDEYVSFMVSAASDDVTRDQLKWMALNRLYAIAIHDGDTEKAKEYDTRRREHSIKMAGQ